ncbi:cytochrome P450 [Nocardioides sp.]|uniref:cytochrome P450 n=1 Tax=Nocardioides sp. TaxID=35761 RepID=UPI002733B54D|nr:cytochrome P450 [Nocardioides sp.]MDP3889946.1 cytochrome P450 [Nocardioides sp.]
MTSTQHTVPDQPAGSPAAVFDPYDYVTQEDPYPTYARLRREAPVYYNAERDFWALSRHADVHRAVRDEATFSNAMGVSLDPTAWSPHAHKTMSFLAMDPPRQTRLRNLVSRGFTPRRVAGLADRIREITLQHLEPALERGSFDFVDDFAGLLPMDVISELMGVPVADRVELRRLADVVVHREDGVYDVPPEGMSAALDLVVYYADLVQQRRADPGDDLTSALTVAEIDGDRLTDEEIIGFLFLMVVAGNETTTKLLANAVFWGARHPDQLAKPLADPGRVDDWVEETLRYDTSSQLLARHVTRDVEIDGVTVPADSRLVVLLGSANRDERVFTCPDTYDLDRDPAELGQHISFGGGRHFCLGANLARLEARVALDEVARRVSSIEVDEARAVRVHSVNVRGFAHLPVSVVRS